MVQLEHEAEEDRPACAGDVATAVSWHFEKSLSSFIGTEAPHMRGMLFYGTATGPREAIKLPLPIKEVQSFH